MLKLIIFPIEKVHPGFRCSQTPLIFKWHKALFSPKDRRKKLILMRLLCKKSFAAGKFQSAVGPGLEKQCVNSKKEDEVRALEKITRRVRRMEKNIAEKKKKNK